VKEALQALVDGRDLDAATIEASIGSMMEGAASPAQIGGFLACLSAKGETVVELVAAVRALRARCVAVRVQGPLVDLCGTGGDGLGTFNISTAASFVAAAAGARVAKHGNRAASGPVGAADVLEALGVALELSPERSAQAIERFGIAFLFAPSFHPAMRNVAPVRRDLGIRTVFNLAGPLANPAGVTRQLIGVYSPRWLEPVARAALELGAERVMVVHGDDGSDELSPAGPTRVVEGHRGALRTYDVDPATLGITACAVEDLAGGSLARNVEIVRCVLGGAKGPCSDAVALNAGAALYVGGLADSLENGLALARRVLVTGKGLRLLEEYAVFSRSGITA
jgi:anthranilate phosphoribosyltransferase